MYIVIYKDRFFFKEEQGWSYSDSLEDGDIFLHPWEAYEALYNIRTHYPVFSPHIKQIQIVDFHDEQISTLFRRMSQLKETLSPDELIALRSML